jgi:hypothetical protein
MAPGVAAAGGPKDGRAAIDQLHFRINAIANKVAVG